MTHAYEVSKGDILHVDLMNVLNRIFNFEDTPKDKLEVVANFCSTLTKHATNLLKEKMELVEEHCLKVKGKDGIEKNMIEQNPITKRNVFKFGDKQDEYTKKYEELANETIIIEGPKLNFENLKHVPLTPYEYTIIKAFINLPSAPALTVV